jgi:hypothetical protein
MTGDDDGQLAMYLMAKVDGISETLPTLVSSIRRSTKARFTQSVSVLRMNMYWLLLDQLMILPSGTSET